MKRFYKQVSTEAADGGHRILLDGRGIKTPERTELIVPSERLAAAIAEEWDAQGEKIDPRALFLTGLAYAAIDRIAPRPDALVAGLARYGESDLLYYRADGPEPLVARQAETWDKILQWARRRFDVDFEIVTGIIHRAQPAQTVERLARAVAAQDPFRLAALSPLVTLSGSLLIALALLEGEIDVETAWAAATVDETWQAEQWGEDALAVAALDAKRREFETAYRFLELL